MRVKKSILIVVILTIVMVTGSSWGFLVHRTVTQLAVYQLPKPMKAFFYSNMNYLVINSVRPDIRRNQDSTEAPRHFIDLEAFGDSAAWRLPMKWIDALRQFKMDTFFKYGYLPYNIIRLKERLSYAFSTRNKDSILFYAGDI